MSSDPLGGPSIIWSLPIMTIPPETPLESEGIQEGLELGKDVTSVLEPPPSPSRTTVESSWNESSMYIHPLMGIENCSEPLQNVAWENPGLISSLVIFVAINGLVVAGNVLVILAVFSTPKLRTVTNLFISSLAVADLLLGIAVLPFSVTVEVFQTWLFGELWCSVWLAVDVWMSTASILNLCVISLDRYVAVTRPVKYPSLMTSTRAKLLIAGVWVASFVICFPPLVGWNDRHKNLAASDIECVLTCELTNDIGYVLYSAMGSFFIPMLVMLFFYWKIYLAAIETTRAINRGFRTTKNRTQRFDEEKVTLRIHVGRNNSLQGNDRSAAAARTKRFSSVKIPRSTLDPHREMFHEGNIKGKTRLHNNKFPAKKFSLEGSNTGGIGGGLSPGDYRSSGETLRSGGGLSPSSGSEGIGSKCGKEDGFELMSVNSGKLTPKVCSRSESTLSMDIGLSVNSSSQSSTSQKEKGLECDNGALASKTRGTSRIGRRNIKVQVKRFKMETKAAKTLGIIVGIFIICWFPFFTMYLVRGFCVTCIHPLVFSVFFWLGYCNSAINPCIYALFSKDFRFAFKKILCRCICRREKRKWPLPMPGLYLPSFGDESDENFEESGKT